MDYFGNMAVFKNYNGCVVFLSILISISLFHDLLINLFLGPSFPALVGLSFARRPFARRFFCASSSSSA